MKRSNPWAAVHAKIEARTGKTVRQLLAEQQAARAPQGAAPLPPAAPAPARPTQRPRKPRVRIDLGPPNLPWSFTILGDPATKNTGKVTRDGRVVPPKKWRRWFKNSNDQVLAIRARGVRGTCKESVDVTAVFYREKNIGDEDRYKVALGDFLERAGFVWNDSLIHWTGDTRRALDPARPRIEVTITSAGAPRTTP